MTVRDSGTTTKLERRVTNKDDGDEVTMLLRTYNHWRRGAGASELTPGELYGSNLTMAMAFSCTTAAPIYFGKVWIEGRRYIDGGVAANNPAVITWNEATQMAQLPHLVSQKWMPTIFPGALVSIGLE